MRRKRKTGCKNQNEVKRNRHIYDLDIGISNKKFKPGLVNILKHGLQIYWKTQENMVKLGEPEMENHSQEMEKPKKEPNGIITREKYI